VKPSVYAFRSAADDGLVINEATRHQYYSTMQAEVCNEDLLDEALNRRHARALLERDEQSRRGYLAAALALCVVTALLLWVF
jgi:hypothetical protein